MSDDAKRQADLQRRLAAQTLADDTRWLMADPRGKRLVRQWLADAGVSRTTFVVGDTHASAFNEGMRNFGLKMQAQVIEHAQADYLRMLAGDGSLNPQGPADTAAP